MTLGCLRQAGMQSKLIIKYSIKYSIPHNLIKKKNGEHPSKDTSDINENYKMKMKKKM